MVCCKRAYFSKFRAMGRQNPLKQHVNLKVLECKNVEQTSKGAFRAGITRNKCLK